MKRFIYLCTLSFAILISNTSIAQEFGTNNFRSEFNKAIKHMKAEEYRYAYSIFQSLNEANPDNANIEYHMGLCLMDQKYEKEEALIWFLKASKNYKEYYGSSSSENSAPIDVFYYIGMCHHYNSNYSEAIKWYEEYIEKANPRKASETILRAKLKIDWCKDPSLLTPPDIDQLSANEITPPKKTEEYYAKIMDALEIINLDHFQALYILNPILKIDPNNSNINYFVGIACLNIRDLRSISPKYLTKAVEKMDARLLKKNARSQAAPLFANYYLGLAWYENNRCDLAVPNYRAFLSIMETKDPYAKEIVEHKIELCDLQQAELDSILLAESRKPKVFNLEEDSLRKAQIGKDTSKDRLVKDGAVTESKDGYFYAVQVGAGNIDTRFFDKLRKLDKNNNLPFPKLGTKTARSNEIPGDRMRRFIIGKFKTLEEAQPLLQKVKDLGYEDAFIGQFQEHTFQQ